MKLRRLMQIAVRGQSLPKGSVVRHSKIGPPMTLWVIFVRSARSRRSRDVRFAPKADMRELASICPLRAKSGLMHRSKEYLYSITLSAHEHRADSSSILCIEPCVDNFLCLGNNRFFGTFLKRCRTFGQRR